MALTNLETAINALGKAKAEFGLHPEKLALLETARAALAASLVGDTSLTGAKIPLANSALTHTIFAVDCANNNMSGSGREVPISSTEQKLNEPFHTAKAFEDALAALTA